MSSQDPVAHDVLFIDSLSIAPTIGRDWWGRVRPQPLFITVQLYLQPGYLDKAGASDDVRDSVHYGQLCKSVLNLAYGPDAQVFDGPRDLARAVVKTAFALTGAVIVQRAAVAIKSEKLIPLAGEFLLEISTSYRQEVIGGTESVRVTIKNLVLSTIIGVNPPEREAKQRVVVTIIVHEKSGHGAPVDYAALTTLLNNDIGATSYLTLEKFVLEIIRIICLFSETIDVVTVKAEKPSALSFAQAAGVQMTRSRSAFLQ
ncbi:Dihydroneopterin aldolase-domain-containing protein [Fomitopsis serialis]|uniref:Dihydroneopterin aldolase-domain-containing protein n=1 Tax=Fomitopsis serialis TaxID=139415 RepID=UPI002008344C|nr:Dihydroneopterin aldolase-domain-containing protein [Neoantrodia serialis]KAH9915311.1 Dihydroneopterin aldolase-domain-containing protein [Neoantrodia serialis]